MFTRYTAISDNDARPLCVLGIVNTERGIEIAEGMKEWILPHYRLIEVYHDGTQFEYPALWHMQEHCHRTGEPCLYLHTRGAFHRWNTTQPTHRMWQYEFTHNKEYYFNIVNDKDIPIVACPFTGNGGHTWYNGFVANAAAMTAIPEIQPSRDRMVYERLFHNTGVTVIGTIYNTIHSEHELGAARRYLLNNYK